MYHSVLLKTRMYHTVLLKTNSCLCTIEGTHLSLSTSEDSNYHLVLLKTQIFNSILLKTQINLSFNTLKTPMYHSVTVLLKAQIYCSVLLKTQIYFARILYTHSGKCRLNVKTNKKQKQKDLKNIKIFFRRRERGKKRKKASVVEDANMHFLLCVETGRRWSSCVCWAFFDWPSTGAINFQRAPLPGVDQRGGCLLSMNRIPTNEQGLARRTVI